MFKNLDSKMDDEEIDNFGDSILNAFMKKDLLYEPL